MFYQKRRMSSDFLKLSALEAIRLGTEDRLRATDGDVAQNPVACTGCRRRHGGSIRQLDRHGNCVECRQYQSPEWWEWYTLFDKADIMCRFFTGQTVEVEDGSTGEIIDIADNNGKNAKAYLLPHEAWIPLDRLKPKKT